MTDNPSFARSTAASLAKVRPPIRGGVQVLSTNGTLDRVPKECLRKTTFSSQESQRNLATDRKSSRSYRPRQQVSAFNKLPVEVVVNILSLLPTADILKNRAICKDFDAICLRLLRLRRLRTGPFIFTRASLESLIAMCKNDTIRPLIRDISFITFEFLTLDAAERRDPELWPKDQPSLTAFRRNHYTRLSEARYQMLEGKDYVKLIQRAMLLLRGQSISIGITDELGKFHAGTRSYLEQESFRMYFRRITRTMFERRIIAIWAVQTLSTASHLASFRPNTFRLRLKLAYDWDIRDWKSLLYPISQQVTKLDLNFHEEWRFNRTTLGPGTLEYFKGLHSLSLRSVMEVDLIWNPRVHSYSLRRLQLSKVVVGRPLMEYISNHMQLEFLELEHVYRRRTASASFMVLFPDPPIVGQHGFCCVRLHSENIRKGLEQIIEQFRVGRCSCRLCYWVNGAVPGPQWLEDSSVASSTSSWLNSE